MYDLGHDLVRVVNPPAALIAQREGECIGEVGGIGGRERIGGVPAHETDVESASG